ncbi:MAG: trigger factor [Verrucomicrobia bacterium]|nr:trigger factor [Verrucomicrobiota bacterium]
MNVEVETQPHCITNLRVEVPAERVAQERQNIVKDFTGQVRLPGYRPGKAPRSLVEAKFKKDIAEELKRKLVGAVTREAIAEKKLRVLSVADVENVELGADNTMKFAARLITAPEFELPEYKGLAVKLPPAEIAEAEVDGALERMRARLADFVDLTEDRGLQMGDFAVLDFAGRLEGKPLSEVAPKAARELGGQENFWIKMGPETLLPGFCEHLLGARAGETRDFSVTIASDFASADLAGKTLDYTVKVRELKQQVLPEIDDAFAAKLLPGKSLTEVRAQVRKELEGERASAMEELKRRQLVQQLIGAVDFELPDEFVRNETRRIMDDVVRENQERGVSDEEIRGHEPEIAGSAQSTARERLKANFILLRIAEKEGIKATREDFDLRLNLLAARYKLTREKLLENLRANNALGQLEEEILLAKTLAFVGSNATVETITPPAPGAAAENAPEKEEAEVPAGGS